MRTPNPFREAYSFKKSFFIIELRQFLNLWPEGQFCHYCYLKYAVHMNRVQSTLSVKVQMLQVNFCLQQKLQFKGSFRSL